MCLGIPMRITKVENAFKGMASAFGVSRPVRLELVRDVKAGDFVLVHAGFAVTKLDAEEAALREEFFRQFLDTEQEDE